jgi:hypothetical protein
MVSHHLRPEEKKSLAEKDAPSAERAFYRLRLGVDKSDFEPGHGVSPAVKGTNGLT